MDVIVVPFSNCKGLGDLLPERAVARSEKRVFAGIPTQEMRGVGVLGVRVTTGPDFVKQIVARLIHGTMEIESEAALFFS